MKIIKSKICMKYTSMRVNNHVTTITTTANITPPLPISKLSIPIPKPSISRGKSTVSSSKLSLFLSKTKDSNSTSSTINCSISCVKFEILIYFILLYMVANMH